MILETDSTATEVPDKSRRDKESSFVNKGLRILLLTEGGVANPLASSGINHHLHRALSKHYEVLVADIKLHGWRRYANALYAFGSSPGHWRRAYFVNLWAFEQKTRLSEQILRQHRGQYDLIFQIYATYAPDRQAAPKPYVVYEDCTHRMAAVEYPPLDTFRPHQRDRWYHQETQLYQRAGAVFARSTRMKDTLVDFYRVDPASVAIVGAGINFDSWSGTVKNDDGRTLLFVGKDFERKGGYYLLQAFEIVRAHIPDAHLIVAGPARSFRQEGVTFVGRVDNREHLRELYASATLFVMPSLFDSWGNVFPEAMAHRLPCIGTTAGGIPDIIVDGETGYLVPPKQPDILAERILSLLRDSDLARRMGQHGYQRATQVFTWDRVVERMRPHLEHLLS